MPMTAYDMYQTLASSILPENFVCGPMCVSWSLSFSRFQLAAIPHFLPLAMYTECPVRVHGRSTVRYRLAMYFKFKEPETNDCDMLHLCCIIIYYIDG